MDKTQEKNTSPQEKAEKNNAIFRPCCESCGKADINETAADGAKVEVVGVNFDNNRKSYYFDPKGMTLAQNTEVIVETARGTEFGRISIPNKFVSEKEIVSPLKPVVRIATESDKQRHAENTEKEKEAFAICEEKIKAHGLGMKLIEAEYTFDNAKLIFYFTADGRIDFRELVNDLARVFKTRIELRQIGIRDETKLIGGLGMCGRVYCCNAFLDDFVQVSIKMAKEQNLSLNSAKISGACGRLMCCLKYEQEVYEEEISKTPPVGTTVETPDGEGTVVETNPLAAWVKVQFSDGENSSYKTFNRNQIKIK